MINPVSSSPAVQTHQAAKPAQTPPPAQHKSSPQQDTVQLSPQARAAAGDVDHDGDSH